MQVDDCTTASIDFVMLDEETFGNILQVDSCFANSSEIAKQELGLTFCSFHQSIISRKDLELVVHL